MILKWFAEKADKRLRQSQLKLLYQNCLAHLFFSNYTSVWAEVGDGEGSELVSNLERLELITVDAICRLMWERTLSDEQTKEIYYANALLKDFYMEILNARMALESFGAQPNATPSFADRFRPDGGWGAFGEHEWNKMSDWALKKAEK